MQPSDLFASVTILTLAAGALFFYLVEPAAKWTRNQLRARGWYPWL